MHAIAQSRSPQALQRPFRPNCRTPPCTARNVGMPSRQEDVQAPSTSHSAPATRADAPHGIAWPRCTQHAHTQQTPAPSAAPAHCAQCARSWPSAQTCFEGLKGHRPAGCPARPSRRLARLDEDLGLRTGRRSCSCGHRGTQQGVQRSSCGAWEVRVRGLATHRQPRVDSAENGEGAALIGKGLQLFPCNLDSSSANQQSPSERQLTSADVDGHWHIELIRLGATC